MVVVGVLVADADEPESFVSCDKSPCPRFISSVKLASTFPSMYFRDRDHLQQSNLFLPSSKRRRPRHSHLLVTTEFELFFESAKPNVFVDQREPPVLRKVGEVVMEKPSKAMNLS